MTPKITIDECLEYADSWGKNISIYETYAGWRVVCLLLAEEVRRLREEQTIVGCRIIYTLYIHEHLDGRFLITSSVPGLLLAGPELLELLADAPAVVDTLRRLNGDDRTKIGDESEA